MAGQEKVNEKVEARIALARKRLASVLMRHGVAHQRTLEQKISDAGPTNQRIEPILLGKAMSRMREAGELLSLNDSGTKWHHLPGMPTAFIAERLATQRPVYSQVHNQEFAKHLGAALEVTVYRALLDYKIPRWGGLTHCREHLTPLFDWKATRRLGDRQMPPEWFKGSSFWAAPRFWLNRHLKQARWYARIDPHRGEAYEQWRALLKFETALYCTGIGDPKGPPDEVGLTYEEVLSQLATLLLAKPWNREHPLPAFKLDPQFCDQDVFHLPAFELASRHASSSLRSTLSSIAGRRALILFVANVLGAVDHPLRFTYVRPSPSPGSKVWFDILLSLIRNRERGMEILAKADAYRQAATSSG